MTKMDFKLVNSRCLENKNNYNKIFILSIYNSELTLRGESGFPHSISKVLIWTS